MHCFFYILLPHFSVRTYNLVINDTIICPYFKNIKWRSLTIYSFAQDTEFILFLKIDNFSTYSFIICAY